MVKPIIWNVRVYSVVVVAAVLGGLAYCFTFQTLLQGGMALAGYASASTLTNFVVSMLVLAAYLPVIITASLLVSVFLVWLCLHFAGVRRAGRVVVMSLIGLAPLSYLYVYQDLPQTVVQWVYSVASFVVVYVVTMAIIMATDAKKRLT